MPPTMAPGLIRKIERGALVLGILATLVSVVSLDPKVIGGVFIGAAIGWLNLAVVRMLFERGGRNPEQAKSVLIGMTIKTLLLLTLVGLIVALTGVDGVGFIVGFSMAVLAVLSVPLLQLVAGTTGRGPRGDETSV